MTKKEKPEMSLSEFCEKLEYIGVKIGDDWHIHRKDGRLLSRKCSNGYYMVRKRFYGFEYNFMEHRVIWCLLKGDIPNGLQINHKDFNRANNNIDNLELMTAKENTNYTKKAGRSKYCKGEESGKAIFTNKDVQAARWLHSHGWSIKQIQALYGTKNYNTMRRVIKGDRYCDVSDADRVGRIYQTVVEKAKRGTSAEEAILELQEDMNALFDMSFTDFSMDDAVSKIGDVICNIVFLGGNIGIDFTECLTAR